MFRIMFWTGWSAPRPAVGWLVGHMYQSTSCVPPYVRPVARFGAVSASGPSVLYVVSPGLPSLRAGEVNLIPKKVR